MIYLAAIKLEWWPGSDWNMWPPSSESATLRLWTPIPRLGPVATLHAGAEDRDLAVASVARLHTAALDTHLAIR